MEMIKAIDLAFLEAMKKKDDALLSALRMLRASFKNKAIELLKKELTDEEAAAVIKTEIKKRRDSVEIYAKAGREELKNKEEAEIKILEKFLPLQMAEEEVRAKIKEILAVLAEEDRRNFGKAMAAIMLELKGKADGGIVSKILKETLAE